MVDYSLSLNDFKGTLDLARADNIEREEAHQALIDYCHGNKPKIRRDLGAALDRALARIAAEWRAKASVKWADRPEDMEGA